MARYDRLQAGYRELKAILKCSQDEKKKQTVQLGGDITKKAKKCKSRR